MRLAWADDGVCPRSDTKPLLKLWLKERPDLLSSGEIPRVQHGGLPDRPVEKPQFFLKRCGVVAGDGFGDFGEERLAVVPTQLAGAMPGGVDSDAESGGGPGEVVRGVPCPAQKWCQGRKSRRLSARRPCRFHFGKGRGQQLDGPRPVIERLRRICGFRLLSVLLPRRARRAGQLPAGCVSGKFRTTNAGAATFDKPSVESCVAGRGWHPLWRRSLSQLRKQKK